VRAAPSNIRGQLGCLVQSASGTWQDIKRLACLLSGTSFRGAARGPPGAEDADEAEAANNRSTRDSLRRGARGSVEAASGAGNASATSNGSFNPFI